MASPPPQTGRGKLSNTPAPPPLVSPSPPVAAPAPSYSYPTYSPPTTQMSNASLNEKAPQPSPAPSMPPPAYGAGPPVLGTASALYPYIPTDAGDLELQPGDRVQVLEHMNNDCMCERWWDNQGELTRSRVAWPQRAVQPGGHLSPRLRQSPRRQGQGHAAAAATHGARTHAGAHAGSCSLWPDELRQHADGGGPAADRQWETQPLRRHWQEVWQEAGECR